MNRDAIQILQSNGLPITEIIPQLRDSLRRQRNSLIIAPPGSGKTTGIPLSLINEPWLARESDNRVIEPHNSHLYNSPSPRRLLVVEPRRLAAIHAATRVAALLEEEVGITVGYTTRNQSRVSRRTIVEFITDGILINRLERDPEMSEVGGICFDEAHERSINLDLALAMLIEIQQTIRPDLRLLIMSATINSSQFSNVLSDAAMFTSNSATYPVECIYRSIPFAEITPKRVAATCVSVFQETQGDMLVFLPGEGEIRETIKCIQSHPIVQNSKEIFNEVRFLPLYANLNLEEQTRAIKRDPSGKRKIIFSTTIAETSLTIEGVTTVVDSGLIKTPKFSPSNGLSTLAIDRISRDRAEQRKGRAGRLCPGRCYRIWSPEEERYFAERISPEITSGDLATLCLHLANWGCLQNPLQLSWLDPPPPGALAHAASLLKELRLVSHDLKITPLGKSALDLLFHPRLSSMILSARNLNLGAEAILICSIIENRDFLAGEARSTDLHHRYELAIQALYHQDEVTKDPSVNRHAILELIRNFKITIQGMKDLLPLDKTKSLSPEELGKLLSFAYPDRLAKQRESNSPFYQLVTGRGVSLNTHDALTKHQYICVASVDDRGKTGRIFLAAPITLESIFELHSANMRQETSTKFLQDTVSVVCEEQTKLGEIVLKRIPRAAPELALIALLDAVRRSKLSLLPWTEELRAFQARAICLRSWLQLQENNDRGVEASLIPDLCDDCLTDNLEEWLGPWLENKSTLRSLSSADLSAALHSCLSWDANRLLDQEAPQSITVPSGSRIRIEYSPGNKPVLRVKLQEMFGLPETPRIACNLVPLVLHLLSPGQKPIQVTEDLESFWKNTYFEVRRELAGRYPKHPWPDDPTTATPTRRVKPRC